MDIEMGDECDTICVFEDLPEIDFEYEYDVAKFYDFTRSETYEEIKRSEQWFQCAPGYPPSPLVGKLNWNPDDSEDSQASSSVHEYQSIYSTSEYSGYSGTSDVSYASYGNKGPQTLKYKAKCSSQTSLSSGSRLLRPTASQLAKQNQQIVGIHSTRTPRRFQKLGNSFKSTREIVATKRQKLEIGCLRKVARLKHPVCYSHKLPQKVGSGGINSCAKSKVTTPKEPSLETSLRAQRNRSKNAINVGNNLKSNGPSGAIFLQEKSDPIFKLKARPFVKKLISTKQDMSVSQNGKCKTITSKEFKLSSSKKLSQGPPTEVLNKGFKKNVPCLAIQENKISSVVTVKTRSCHPKQSRFDERKPNIFVRNHPSSIRSFAILSN